MNITNQIVQSTMYPRVPRYTLGIDIETKDTRATAYILAIGCVLFDNYTLKKINILDLGFLPDDPEQAHRTESKSTIEWWHTRSNNPRFPTQEAYDRAWGGKLSYSEGMRIFDQFIRELPGKYEVVLPMRGPDFDAVILQNATQDLNLRTPIPARMLDSHRTVERVVTALGLPSISEAEACRFKMGGEPLLHWAVYDASIEGYETARMYYALHSIRANGYDLTAAAFEGWSIEESDAQDLTKV